MAFSLDDLSDVAALNKNRTLWAYITDDAAGLTLSADYFNDASKILSAGDLIDVRGAGGSRLSLSVTAAGSGSVTVQGSDVVSVKDYGAIFDGVSREIGDNLSGVGYVSITAAREDVAVNRLVTPDDQRFYWTAPNASGGLYVATSGGSWAHLTYSTVTPACSIDSQSGSLFEATTGALGNGGGTDGKVSVSAHTDGRLYISNRAGSELTIAYSDIQTTDTIDWFGTQRAVDLAGQQTYGGQVQMPRGRAMLNRAVYGRGNVSLVGAGKYHTTLYATGNNGIIDGQTLLPTSGRVSYRDFTAWGYGDREAGQSSGYQLCRGGWFDYVEFINIHAKESRGFSISAKGTYGAKAYNCLVERSCRDGINFSDSFGDIDISCNELRQVGDDAVAYHLPNAADQESFYKTRATIIGNHFEFSSGVKCLGARNVTVANNTGMFMTGYGVYLGYDATFHQGQNAHYGVNIVDNVFSNVFNVKSFSPAQDLGGGIICIFPPASAGASPYALAAAPGAYDSGTSKLITPDSVLHTLGEDRAVAPAFGVTIARNKVIQTLGVIGGTQPEDFSDWGLGTAWYNTGEVDFACNGTIYDVSTGDAVGVAGCFIKGDTSQIDLHDNHFYGLEDGYLFQTATSKFFGVRIRGGSVHRCRLGVRTPFASATACDIEIRDVDFNLDPFILASGRTSSSGAWTDSVIQNWSALSIQYAVGVRLIGGSIRNARQVAYDNSSTVLTTRDALQYANTMGATLSTCPVIPVDGTISSADYRKQSGVAYRLKTFVFPLGEARLPTDVKTKVGNNAGTNLMGLAAQTGSRLVGNSTNNTAVSGSDEATFLWPVPGDFINGTEVKVEVTAAVTVARQVSATLSLTFREQGNSGLGSDIASASPQSINSITFAAKTFTIAANAAVQTGDEYHIRLQTTNDDTGGSGGAGTTSISKVAVKYWAIA